MGDRRRLSEETGGMEDKAYLMLMDQEVNGLNGDIRGITDGYCRMES